MRFLLLLPILTLPLQAAFLSESATGDISNLWLAPSTLSLDPESNFVSGTVNLGDPDLFTVVVPDGLEIVELQLAFYDFAIPGNQTFIGFQNGLTLQQDPALFTAQSSGDISFFLFGEGDVGRDVLGSFTSSPNASTAPLGPGSYSFWVNEIEPQPASYAFVFVTDFAPAPEPGVLGLLGIALLGALRRRR